MSPFAKDKPLWKHNFTAEEIASFTLTPREIERQEIIHELISTEIEYITDLTQIEENYYKPMQQFNFMIQDILVF